MKRGHEKNWVDLQRQLDWLADGVVIGTIPLDEYIRKARELLDSYEFMVVHRG